ncbi:MAG: DUF3078 domain-containing protein [Paludibacteraceae bacterium]|nr:DUF3078 domain-containing protein [Paludibacteraceae bacterium]
MRKTLMMICSLTILSALCSAQIQMHPDTISTDQLIIRPQENATDSLMLLMLRRQALANKHRQDSINRILALTDTTDLLTRHIGWSDSVRIAQTLKRNGTVGPLTSSFLVYMPCDLTAGLRPSSSNIRLNTDTVSHRLRLHEPAQQPDRLAGIEREDQVWQLRSEARNYITRHAPQLYTTTPAALPPTGIQRIQMEKTQLDDHYFVTSKWNAKQRKIRKTQVTLNDWYKTATGLAQFTQNYVSKNWYKGGNSTLAVLGIIKGNIVYRHGGIEWDNQGEWRMGFSNVSGDTIHKIATNEDLFKVSSKLGVKMLKNGKLNYAATIELQTQLFRTWSGINSTTLKTTFFSPFRLNAGIGIDYKPSKNLSVVVSPLAYKCVLIYDTAHIDQTAYGIDRDRKALSEWGSSVNVTHTWKPLHELQVDTRLYLYTNYQAIEFELEVVGNFIINRFMSTRVSIYPRFDNTTNRTSQERARLQFKELISIGFSHTFR